MHAVPSNKSAILFLLITIVIVNNNPCRIRSVELEYYPGRI